MIIRRKQRIREHVMDMFQEGKPMHPYGVYKETEKSITGRWRTAPAGGSSGSYSGRAGYGC